MMILRERNTTKNPHTLQYTKLYLTNIHVNIISSSVVF